MKRKIVGIMFTLLLVVPSICWAGEILRYRLDNGMRVVLRENHAAAVTALQVWVRVGSADERAIEAGMSHFIEHMIFKGTNERRAGEIAKTIERYGGEINAYTSYDHTVYHAVIASRYQDTGLEILADALQHPSFDPQEVAREKEVVVEEIRMGEDDPGHRLHENLFSTSFQRHPYGRPVIGYAEKVKGFSRDDVIAYYKRWYIPGNMVIVAVGDFKAQEILARLKVLFTSPPRSLPERTRPSEPSQKSLRARIMREDVKERYCAIGFHIPNIKDDDVFALDLLAALLGQGESSRLQRDLRFKRGVVNSLYAYSFTPIDPGLLVIGGTLKPEGIREGIKGIMEGVSWLKREGGIGEEELSKVKVMVEADFTYARETVQGEARGLGYFEVDMGDATKQEEYLRNIRQVSCGKITQVARRYLRSDNLTISLLVPEGEREADDTKAIEELVKGLEVSGAPQQTTGALQRIVLGNGITILFLEDHSLPVVGICGVFLGGVRFETEKKAGITHFLSEMLTRGTEQYTALQLAQEVDALGATVSAFSGRNSFGVQAKGLSKDFSHLVKLMAEVIAKPSFPSDEVEKVRGEILTDLGEEKDRLIPWTMRLLQEILYERHPYRMNVLGQERTIQRITQQDLKRYYKRYAVSQNMVIAVVGDATWGEVTGSITESFYGMRRASLTPPAVPQELRKIGVKKREVTLEKRQVHIALGFLGTTIQDQDRFPLDVLEAILGGQGGRFFSRLRDEEGLAYVVSFFVRSDLDPGYMGIYLATSPEKTEHALQGIKRVLTEVWQRGISQEELERAKGYLIGMHEIGIQGPLPLAFTLALDERYGLGGDFYRSYPRQIEKVTAEDVTRVIRKYITMDSYSLVIIGPSSP